MRILFVQLPMITHSYEYASGNIEYASAAISGYIKKRFKAIDMEIMPFSITYFGSDMLIEKYITAIDPDIIAFSCFLWNIERNLKLATDLKQRCNAQIIFGGSEIQVGSYALEQKRDQVDYFVIGEGEWFFHIMLSGDDLNPYTQWINNNKVILQPERSLIPAKDIYEPFTGKRLNPMLDGTVYLELYRGCPYKCSYCYYSKRCISVRELSFDLLVKALSVNKTLRHRWINEIYILAPAFERTRNFKGRLEQLISLNHDITLHTEMRAEGIDADQAVMLYKAGFRSLEVGLQTLNKETLQRIGRKGSPESEIEGMMNLARAGLDLKIGIIPGLPGDTVESFIQTINRLQDLGLSDSIELYPLMILPGTKMREDADKEKINYNRRPPYFYNSGWGMSFDDLQYISEYTEGITGYSNDQNYLPDLTVSDKGIYCKGVIFNGDTIGAWDGTIYIDNIHTNVFNFLIYFSNPEIMYRGLKYFLKSLPQSGLFNIIFFAETSVEERLVIDVIIQADEETLHTRMNIFNTWHEQQRIRFYQVYNNYGKYAIGHERYTAIVPILKIDEKNAGDLELIDIDNDRLFIKKGMLGIIMDTLPINKIPAENIIFEDENDQKEYYRIAGYNYTEIPISFYIGTDNIIRGK